MATISINISPELMQACGGNIQIELYCDGSTAGNIRRTRSTETVGAYIERLAGRMEGEGRPGTAANYRCAARSLDRLCGTGELTFERLDEATMRHYEARLKHDGLKMNTISFYMRTLRAAYNMAVSEGLTQDHHPFRSVYTGISPTGKRAVGMDTIRKISRMQLRTRRMAMARDMFMFSFYTRGMSFVDMAYLRKKDVAGGMLAYRRRKTGRQLTVRWERCMREITSKYAPETRSTPYLLPLVKTGDDERRQYRNALCRVNNALKAIAPMVGLSMPLTMYCARHAWASIAKSKHIPLPVISEGMGHDSEQTTRIYLASLDTSVIDRANKLILDSL